MAGLRSVAWLVALLLVASLLVNFRYVKYTSAVQDPCPRPAEPARAATPASAEVQPASKLPGVQAPMHRRRAPLPATTPQASTAEPAHSGAAGAVEDHSLPQGRREDFGKREHLIDCGPCACILGGAAKAAREEVIDDVQPHGVARGRGMLGRGRGGGGGVREHAHR